MNKNDIGQSIYNNWIMTADFIKKNKKVFDNLTEQQRDIINNTIRDTYTVSWDGSFRKDLIDYGMNNVDNKVDESTDF